MRQLHVLDLADGYGDVYLPYALDCKYPNAAREYVSTTMIYTHVLNKGGNAVISPLNAPTH